MCLTLWSKCPMICHIFIENASSVCRKEVVEKGRQHDTWINHVYTEYSINYCRTIETTNKIYFVWTKFLLIWRNYLTFFVGFCLVLFCFVFLYDKGIFTYLDSILQGLWKGGSAGASIQGPERQERACALYEGPHSNRRFILVFQFGGGIFNYF